MGEIIYWEKYDEPKRYIDLLGKEREIPGEYICNDERVERFWFFGGMGMNQTSGIAMFASFIFKDGTKHETKIIPSPEDDENIKQAEDFLQSIK